MKVIWLSVIFWATVSTADFEQNSTLNPCDDFYDYVCQQTSRTITNLTFTGLYEELEVQQPNETFFNNGTYTSLENLVNLSNLTQWCVEMEVLSLGYYNYIADGLNSSEKLKEVMKRLDGLNSTNVNIFYNALHANVEILNQMNIPVVEENQFLHNISETLKIRIRAELESSSISDKAKTHIKKSIETSKQFYAFYDHNDVKVFETAKLTYETEYYRLKSLLSPEDIQRKVSESILRIGATTASMEYLMSMIPGFDVNFLFHAIIASPENDAFQYNGGNHLLTVITRNDLTQQEKTMADTYFITTHEIMHLIYPVANSYINESVWSGALECTLRDVKMLGETDAVKPVDGWYNADIGYEDLINVMAMRVLMKMAAEKSVNEQQLKEALETVIGGLCKHTGRKNELIPDHHPLEISRNAAVRQYPLFNSLYGCKAGDRMFAKPNEYCKPLGDPINVEDFLIKNETRKDAGGFFKDVLNTAERFNFTYGL
ncbi:Peptidase_M13_N domain-containing protein [Caenorhabditis elegans]|uniref:Peptidase_M13_N domain-containing protein n=1 Tax=Caenorhabditis elegans TaxID=6239 RepID=P91519_CAEEL|nr:Peptidase_M13_N domain-containing protein [Caenorhabditis elegans]CCD70576.2 Peptidase_M13_N domain-containing protein [Caenorhabditis elegans]|eukprot:NP_503902.3 Uncharacterized protein CELE_T28A11.20 [Caenorhabditis elegans]